MGSARAGSNPVGVDFSAKAEPLFFCVERSACFAAATTNATAWPSGLRRQLKALVRKGVGSNPTAVIFSLSVTLANVRDLERRTKSNWGFGAVGSA